MEIIAFKTFYSARIGMQVAKGFGGNDFAVYVGVIDGDVPHAEFEPTVSGGKGQMIPGSVKMSYKDARAQFDRVFDDLERTGHCWRY